MCTFSFSWPPLPTINTISLLVRFPLFLFSRSLLILTLSWSGRAAKPSVKYSDHITVSPSLADAFVVQNTDNDTDNDGGHHSPSHIVSPRSFSDAYPKRGYRTSAQSTRRRMTYGGRTTSVVNSVNTLGQAAPPTTTMLQRARMGFSNLLVPGHKIGKPPGFVRELKTILFGSCASCYPIS